VVRVDVGYRRSGLWDDTKASSMLQLLSLRLYPTNTFRSTTREAAMGWYTMHGSLMNLLVTMEGCLCPVEQHRNSLERRDGFIQWIAVTSRHLSYRAINGFHLHIGRLSMCQRSDVRV
jgi:hypothetical protein